LWISGRKDLFDQLRQKIDPGDKPIWFHCSSLGEFEQGRPVIEKIRKTLPGKKILLTFYSPSGYEIRKNYQEVDYVFYLPLDTGKNARRFLEIVNPEYVFFVKYEFWYHFLNHLKKQTIKTYLVSGIFRSGQLFFRKRGWWFRKMLECFNHFFVQDPESERLLHTIGIDRVTVTGDTRFDRVYAITSESKEFPLIGEFTSGHTTVICGSTWPGDEELLIRFMKGNSIPVKFIIAPHETHEGHIKQLQNGIPLNSLRYTALEEKPLQDIDVLIIDTMGILSSLYRYGNIAYIGGGFGKGIHNTLEAATFGLPVIFGPRYQKFREAIDLVNKKAAFPVSDYDGLEFILSQLLKDQELLKNSGQNARSYVQSNLGATDKIVNITLIN